MSKNKAARKYGHILPALLLSLAMMLGSLGACFRINQIANDSCSQVLSDIVGQVADDIKIAINGKENQMLIITELLANQDLSNTEACRGFLSSLHPKGMVSSFSVLLPDNQMIYPDDTENLMKTAPDFPTESRKYAHLSKVFEGTDNEKYISYMCPIEKNDEVTGILYGYVRLKDLPNIFKVHAYDNMCDIYIINGTTGDFLVDT